MSTQREKRENRPQYMQSRGPGRRGHNLAIPVEKAKDFKGTLRRLLIYLKPHRIKLILALLLASAGTIFNIFGPKVLGMATDSIYDTVKARLGGSEAAMDYGYLTRILLVLVGLYMAYSIFSYLTQYLMVGISQKTVYNLREEVSRKLEKLPLKYYDSNTHGEILSRVTNDIDNISNTLQQSLNQILTSLVSLVGIIVMMLTISTMLTLVTLVTLPLSMLITRQVAKRSQKYFKEQQKVLGNLNGHIEEMYTGHKIVKAFNYEKDSEIKFDGLNERLCEVGIRAQFISGIIMPLMIFVGNIGYVIVCAAGSFLVTRNMMTLGGIQAFIQYSRQFSHPIVQIANIANIIQSTIASAERVFEILDEEEEVEENNSEIDARSVSGGVSFESISFSYKKDSELIKNLNIDVKPGQTVAIVGPTGAGKTTLVNLLMRFYEIDGGNIRIDGRDITDYTRGSLRSVFGMVLQDTWLFKGTIRDNIAYGRLDATDEDIVEAAQAANADHFIRTLPLGYDTVLNEEADNISQGQKQLITIARAILADPQILILDEATSSVDTRTEKCIQKATEKLMEGRTNFVIAHRLSTIIDSDIILVMNDGDIIEKGSHKELIEKGGFYADLYNSQFAMNKAG
ncbi:ATP-binding cassette, subfamily B [Dethiosulfatibacter aminovorans DSM 17477]|uniref:ATP-binding cassette, subfamily B n=1 Tax=Dethiosulfatibacter aminovorans DSM 17477 TaxID=1121476 RepID=A0A1M6F3E3_9FIRM|nr:ABC transporter ATP-binding protein [Dethiosulfatibacter aminovorans]SHI92254.1 ATP-binding cassette, subfamily B [Dethiosulfatibacter aminovorans DSM 17477]